MGPEVVPPGGSAVARLPPQQSHGPERVGQSLPDAGIPGVPSQDLLLYAQAFVHRRAGAGRVAQFGVAPAELVQGENEVHLGHGVLGVGAEKLLVDRPGLDDEVEAGAVLALLIVEAGDVLVYLGQVPQYTRLVRLLEEERFVDLPAAAEGLGGVRAVGKGTVGVGQVFPRLEV